MASIFVQIPSYHDFELYRTIIDCQNKSSGKHDINFGVHVTYFEKNEIDIPNISNLQFSISKAPENIGLARARKLANKFYNGEDYYLQIDSHMRFIQDWDEHLIDDYIKYSELELNPAFSAYPASYEYQDFQAVLLEQDMNVPYTDFIKESSFIGNLVPHQRAIQNPSGNIFTRSVAGGCIFTSGELAAIVPNENIFFWGEEILTAARLYTHGFDLMLPTLQNFYHLYYNHDKEAENLRRQVRNDFPKESEDLEEISRKELDSIFLEKRVGPDALGNKRTLEEYEYFAGINFLAKNIVPVI
jgi:hypothetical protein